MTPTQYKAALKALGLSQHLAGDWLGIGRRTSQGYALGEYPVPEPVAKLLRLVVEIRAIEKATGETQHSKSIGYLKILAALSRC